APRGVVRREARARPEGRAEPPPRLPRPRGRGAGAPLRDERREGARGAGPLPSSAPSTCLLPRFALLAQTVHLVRLPLPQPLDLRPDLRVRGALALDPPLARGEGDPPRLVEAPLVHVGVDERLVGE